MKRPLAYITAPWGDDPRENGKTAARYCREVYDAGYSPVCPVLFLPTFLKDNIPQEHKDGIDMARDLVAASYISLASALAGDGRKLTHSAAAPLPTKSTISRGPRCRAHVLVVCGESVDESMKNDIAIAERLHITATTMDGILTVKGQGRDPKARK